MPLILFGAYLIWKGIKSFYELPDFLLPSPERVGRVFIETIADGSIWVHVRVTASEALLGFTLALVFATTIGYLLGKSKVLEKVFSPYLIAAHSTPIIAIAPLLVIWLGFGMSSKVAACFIIVFFPILINTMTGIREVDTQQKELMKSYSANKWQTFRKLEVPAALPFIFVGMKLGITISVVGAVVGEFVGADKGLGYLINVGKGLFDTSLIFVSIFWLVSLALILYGSVCLLEYYVLAWKRQ
jgi:NitT/TauT family transport system permease protein